LCALLSLQGAAYGQSYPARPIRMLIPFSVGGPADIIARVMEPATREKLGVAIVIDNRAGAGGNIATEIVAKSTADGYTILMATIGTHAINQSLYSKLNFHPVRDFSPIALICESPNALVVHPKLPVNSVPELIALARSKPGTLNYGSGGSGTTLHLSAELFSVMTGVKMVHVPFKGVAEALPALLGGRLDLIFASLPSAMPFIKSGKLKAFAVTGAKRSASIPELPTVAEAADLPGFAASAWFGWVGPAGMPRNAVSTLNKTAYTVLDDAEVSKRFFAAGFEKLGGSPEHFSKFIAAEIEKWAAVVKASGARVD
jgi:tripartite-type tricarboxylate transporter receptor subunit TctC